MSPGNPPSVDGSDLLVSMHRMIDGDWEQLGKPVGLHRLILRRLQQLLDVFGTEEGRPATTTSLEILKELAVGAERAQLVDGYRKHSLQLLEELAAVVSRERDLGLRLVRLDERRFKTLSEAITQSKWASGATLSKSYAQVLEKTYYQSVVDLIEAELSRWLAAGIESRPRLGPTAGLLEVAISHLRTAGHSTEFLQGKLGDLLVIASEQARSPAWWNDAILAFLGSFPVELGSFVCAAAAKAPKTSALSNLGTQTLSWVLYRSDQGEQSETTSALNPSQNAWIGSVELTARDRFSAARLAWDLLQASLSVAQVAQASTPITVWGRVAVQENGGSVSVVPVQFEAFRNRKGKAKKTWMKHANRLVGLNSSGARSLQTAFRQHRSAAYQQESEARLVSLWIGMETLFKEGDGATIARVAQGISAVMAGRYVRRRLTNLAILLLTQVERGVASRVVTHVAEGAVGDSSGDPIDKYALVRILSCAKGSTSIEELYDLVTDYPLVCHEIARARAVLIDPAKLSKALERHRQRVDWQVRRIYRARNEIVHSGVRPRMLDQLIRHAQYYLSELLFALVYDLGGEVTVDTVGALRYRVLALEGLVGALQEDESKSQVHWEELEAPTRWLVGGGKLLVWWVRCQGLGNTSLPRFG